MDLGLAGRTALVTASSKGLGLASALALAEAGARLSICARGEEGLREAERRLAAAGADVLATRADVTDPAVPAALVAATVARFGALDVLVANAPGPPPGRSLDLDDAAIEAAVNANLLASVRLVRHALPPMRAQGWGRICLIASNSVKQPIPNLALSNTARTGLWAWAKTAAADLMDDGITLNLACPGLHRTDRILQLGSSAPHMGDPADFGRVVAFLCSEPACFVSGTALAVDGAATTGLL